MIALSTPGPDTVKQEWVAEMAHDSMIFVCANPVPEISSWEAKEAGARIVAIEQRAARLELSRDELYERASRIIDRARREIRLLMDKGIIPAPPED